MTNPNNLNNPGALQAQIEILTTELYGLDRKIAEKLAREADEMAEKSLLAFYQSAWNEFESDIFIPNWHHTAMCEALEALYKNDISNLIIQISPGCSKSSLTSVVFPVWCWLQDPSLRFITASAIEKLALRDPVRSRRLINSEWFQSKWGDRFELLQDTNRQSKYENNKFGYRIGTTPSGQGIGERYEIFICFDEKELITTNKGNLKIGDIVNKKLPVKVLTYNHESDRKEWSDILEYEKNPSKPLYKVTFSNGKSFKCTKDHPIFTKNFGYKELKDCSIGDTCYATSANFKGVLTLREGSLDSSYGKILFSSMYREKSNNKTRSLLYYLQEINNQVSKRFKTLQKSLLFQRLQRYFKFPNTKKESYYFLSNMFKRNRNSSLYDKKQKILLSGMQNIKFEKKEGDALSYLFTNLYQKEFQTDLLLSNMCIQTSSNENIRKEKPELYSRGMSKSICTLLSQDTQTKNKRTGWLDLPIMFSEAGESRDTTSHSPYRLQQKKWGYSKPNQFMQEMSWENAWKLTEPGNLEEITITNIELTEHQPSWVYNIRTKNRNYFCQGILVHNCDDPHKPAEIYSEVAKDKIWLWYSETMSTRGGRNPRKCIMHQRLAEDDLIGRILESEGFNKWEVLNFPMEYEKTTYAWTSTNILPNRDPRTKEGELMWPSKYDYEDIANKKKELRERGYSAQFMQRPVSKEGGVIKKEYLKPYSFVTKQLLLSNMDYLIGSWDLTFTDTGNSYCVGQVWGRKGADKYLIDQYRGKWDFPNQVRFMRQMKEDYPMIRGMLVEKKANGDALISTLKKEVPGIVPVKLNEIGGGDKLVRLMACITEFEAGNIYIPNSSYYAWVKDFIDELTTFPVGKTDDQIDACTQALNYLALKSHTIKSLRLDNKDLQKFITTNTEKGLLRKAIAPSNSLSSMRNIFN